MKHSRGEIVRCIVGSYMKRRKYSENENFRKADLPSTRTSENSVVSGLIDVDSSHPNSIMYKCVNNDPTVAEAQFCNLKAWINELPCQEAAEELKTLLFPLLCHLYLEMLSGGHKVAASTFLKKHQSVSSEEGFQLLQELATIECTKDIEEKKILSSLRSSKYHVTLSSATIQLLKQYLMRKAHVILLQITNSWFDVEEVKAADALMDLLEQDMTPQANGFQEHQTHPDNDVAKLEEIIRLVKEGPSAPSPLLVYSVQNTDEGLSCGIVSNDGLLLAGGFKTSEVRLWSLTEKTFEKKKPCAGSIVLLAVDLPNTEENDSASAEQIKPETASISKSEAYILRGHSGTVQDLAFVPKTDFLVSVGMDKTMRAWDLNTLTCPAVYRGHNYPIWCVDTSPLQGYVATGSHDRTARLWSLEFNFPLRVFAGHQQDVDCMRFHPNGNYLGTGSSDSTVRLWSVDSGELVRVLDGHRSGVMALAFSPDGNYLASAGDDKRIKLWDLRTSNVAVEHKGHSDCVLGLAWSPNGDFLASCASDSSARLWPIKAVAGDDESSVAPKVYSLGNVNVCSISYSPRNTPVCIIGAKT